MLILPSKTQSFLLAKGLTFALAGILCGCSAILDSVSDATNSKDQIQAAPETAVVCSSQEKCVPDGKDDPNRKRLDRLACQQLGVPKIGMTATEAMQTCWGEPAYVNQIIVSRRRLDQYVYPWVGYLFFHDGKLETIRVSNPL